MSLFTLPFAGASAPARALSVASLDFAALFEHLARSAGYTVSSMGGRTLNHAWNRVLLGTGWLIVDVTWNATDSLAGGEPLPAIVRSDPDFRRIHFLATPESEAALQRQGLTTGTHQVADAEPVEYQRTIEATALAERLSELAGRRTVLAGEFNRVARARNRSREARLVERADKMAQRPTAGHRRALRTDLPAGGPDPGPGLRAPTGSHLHRPRR